MLDAIRRSYREVRREVYERATRPSSGDSALHVRNQQCLRAQVEGVCAAATLTPYRSESPTARTALWHHLWSKNRYAGIRSQTATNEISDLTPLFDNYSWFSDRGWDFESHGHRVINAGAHAADFLARSGPFLGLRAVGNVPKLRKIVNVGRQYMKYFDDHRNAHALAFVTDDLEQIHVWAIHQRLLALGYTADLTALHFMMDIGFQVIKPDLVISRLFLDWGWLKYAIPDLPVDLTRLDLIGRGRYGTRFLYTKPRVYRPVIDLAREIVAGIDQADLTADIGWCTVNPLREFDLFVVKAGQLPEQGWGIESRLYS